ncbi:MAG: hypothetical protein HeimC2_35190 [Candidatus Heimdallarchaeota archaeon LC_2]|nr:MAG: hypothetical protein HeimC2_35190 [Candidatus Heimdallarchaeota archaeon LC_2]
MELPIDVSGLALGNYTFVLRLNDTTNNISTDTVFVIVREIDVVGPGDFNYAVGSTGNNITWIGTDGNPNTYSITRDGTEVKSGNWFSGVPIVIDIDDLSIGSYEFNITISDSSSNYLWNVVVVTVVDGTPPIINSPSDIEYEATSSGNMITWIATDDYFDTYEVWNSTHLLSTGSWTSGIAIEYTIDGLVIGSYNFTIIVSDNWGNTNYDTVLITVVDTTIPYITIISETSYVVGTSGNQIIWNVTDPNPSNFSVYINGAIHETGNWNNTDNVRINVDGLELGIYNFEIYAQDSLGNINSSLIILYVIELIDPVYNYLPTNLKSNGTTDIILTWNITDANPFVYEIFLNGVFNRTGIWTNADNVTITYVGMIKGFYSFEAIFYDTSNNNFTHSFIYEVIDEIVPVFLLERPTCPPTPEGENCEGINWWRTNNELYKSHYVILVNGTADVPVIWDSQSISYDVSNFVVGNYNITIIIYDESGNSASSTTWVIIYDGSPPQFFQPPPTRITIIEGSFGNTIVWKNNDTYPGIYEVLQDSLIIFSDTWQALNLNIFNIDGLELGEYNFTIVVYDEAFNPIAFTITVIVIDGNIPIRLEAPSILQINENNTEFTMQWIFSDLHAENYSVLLEGEEILQGIWVSSNPIIVNVGSLGLVPGEYNFTIFVWDDSLNENSQSILIIVRDVVAPKFIFTIPEFEFYTNETNQVISWQVYDLHPSSYSVLIDGILVISNIWDNNEMIIFDLEQLDVGTYNITIIVSDNSDNKVSHSIIIKAKDPLIIETMLPNINLVQIVYEGDIEYYNGTWLTRFEGLSISNATVQVSLFESSKLKIVQGSTFVIYTDENGNFDLKFNYTNVPVGNYIWEIIFVKSDYESRILDIPVIIIPHNYIIEIQIPATLEKGEDYFITAIVYYTNDGNSSDSLSLNQLISNQGKAIGVEVIFNIVILYDDGTTAEIIKKSFTSSKGFAVIQLAGTETLRIKAISKISAAIENNEFGNEFVATLSDSDLPSVRIPSSSGLEIVTGFILNNFSVILLLVVTLGSIIIIIMYTRKRLKVKIKTYLKTMDDAKIELDAILSIRAIIIQASSGLPLYERKFKEIEVDTTLISGLITAFSAFLGEIGREELFGFETIERQGLSITSHKGFNSRLTIISKNELPLILLDQISSSHLEIDSKFRAELTSESGEVLDEDFLDQVFEISGLNIGVIEKFELNSRNIRKIKRMKSITRNVKDNINSLKQLFDKETDDPIYVQNVLEFFKSRGMNEDVSARAFLIAYRYNIINPIFN